MQIIISFTDNCKAVREMSKYYNYYVCNLQFTVTYVSTSSKTRCSNMLFLKCIYLFRFQILLNVLGTSRMIVSCMHVSLTHNYPVMNTYYLLGASLSTGHRYF